MLKARNARVAGLAALLSSWAVYTLLFPTPYLPDPPAVALATWDLALSGELWDHVSASVFTVGLGFAVASGLAMLAGMVTSEWKGIHAALEPLMDFTRVIPALAMLPLFLLMLGIGQASKVAIIMWNAWPAVFIATHHALTTVDENVVEAASLDGAGRWAVLFHIRWPLAWPFILAGVRIGLSGAWVSVVASEMLGSNSGLGFAVMQYSQTFRFPEMWSAILTIGFTGLGMAMILSALQRRYVQE